MLFGTVRCTLFGYTGIGGKLVMNRVLAVIVLAIGLTVSQGAIAKKKGGDLITAADVEAIAEIARGHGTAKVETDRDGDPLIRCKANGLMYSVYFYGCEKGRNCTSIQLQSGFTTDGKVDLDTLLQWNAKKRWLKAIRDAEGDPIVRYDVMLAGGVTTENLDRSFKIFVDMLGDFAKDVGARE